MINGCKFFDTAQAELLGVASACRELALGMPIRWDEISMAAQPGSAKIIDQFSRPSISP